MPTLILDVLKAKFLRPPGDNDKQSLYVSFIIKGNKKPLKGLTKVAKSHIKPVWNERFVFDEVDVTDSIDFKLINKTQSLDDNVGAINVDLKEARHSTNKRKPKWVRLRHTDEVQIKLLLDIRFKLPGIGQSEDAILEAKLNKMNKMLDVEIFELNKQASGMGHDAESSAPDLVNPSPSTQRGSPRKGKLLHSDKQKRKKSGPVEGVTLAPGLVDNGVTTSQDSIVQTQKGTGPVGRKKKGKEEGQQWRPKRKLTSDNLAELQKQATKEEVKTQADAGAGPESGPEPLILRKRESSETSSLTNSDSIEGINELDASSEGGTESTGLSKKIRRKGKAVALAGKPLASSRIEKSEGGATGGSTDDSADPQMEMNRNGEASTELENKNTEKVKGEREEQIGKQKSPLGMRSQRGDDPNGVSKGKSQVPVINIKGTDGESASEITEESLKSPNIYDLSEISLNFSDSAEDLSSRGDLQTDNIDNNLGKESVTGKALRSKGGFESHTNDDSSVASKDSTVMSNSGKKMGLPSKDSELENSADHYRSMSEEGPEEDELLSNQDIKLSYLEQLETSNYEQHEPDLYEIYRVSSTSSLDSKTDRPYEFGSDEDFFIPERQYTTFYGPSVEIERSRLPYDQSDDSSNGLEESLSSLSDGEQNDGALDVLTKKHSHDQTGKDLMIQRLRGEFGNGNESVGSDASLTQVIPLLGSTSSIRAHKRRGTEELLIMAQREEKEKLPGFKERRQSLLQTISKKAGESLDHELKSRRKSSFAKARKNTTSSLLLAQLEENSEHPISKASRTASQSSIGSSHASTILRRRRAVAERASSETLASSFKVSTQSIAKAPVKLSGERAILYNAVIRAIVHPISEDSNHNFVMKCLDEPQICSGCEDEFGGQGEQAIQCEDCDIYCHRRCSADAPRKCKAAKHAEDELNKKKRRLQKLLVTKKKKKNEEGGHLNLEDYIQTLDDSVQELLEFVRKAFNVPMPQHELVLLGEFQATSNKQDVKAMLEVNCLAARDLDGEKSDMMHMPSSLNTYCSIKIGRDVREKSNIMEESNQPVYNCVAKKEVKKLASVMNNLNIAKKFFRVRIYDANRKAPWNAAKLIGLGGNPDYLIGEKTLTLRQLRSAFPDQWYTLNARSLGVQKVVSLPVGIPLKKKKRGEIRLIIDFASDGQSAATKSKFFEEFVKSIFFTELRHPEEGRSSGEFSNNAKWALEEYSLRYGIDELISDLLILELCITNYIDEYLVDLNVIRDKLAVICQSFGDKNVQFDIVDRFINCSQNLYIFLGDILAEYPSAFNIEEENWLEDLTCAIEIVLLIEKLHKEHNSFSLSTSLLSDTLANRIVEYYTEDYRDIVKEIEEEMENEKAEEEGRVKKRDKIAIGDEDPSGDASGDETQIDGLGKGPSSGGSVTASDIETGLSQSPIKKESDKEDEKEEGETESDKESEKGSNNLSSDLILQKTTEKLKDHSQMDTDVSDFGKSSDDGRLIGDDEKKIDTKFSKRMRKNARETFEDQNDIVEESEKEKESRGFFGGFFSKMGMQGNELTEEQKKEIEDRKAFEESKRLQRKKEKELEEERQRLAEFEHFYRVADKIMTCLDSDRNNYEKPFRKLADIATLSAETYHGLFVESIKEFLFVQGDNGDEEGRPADEIWTLYFKTKTMYDYYVGELIHVDPETAEYLDLFKPYIDRWLESQHTQNINWTHQSLNNDQFERTSDSLLHSSCIIDTFNILNETYRNLSLFRWTAKGQWSVWVCQYAETVFECLSIITQYCIEVAVQLTPRNLLTEKPVFCVILNNLHSISEGMRTTYEQIEGDKQESMMSKEFHKGKITTRYSIKNKYKENLDQTNRFLASMVKSAMEKFKKPVMNTMKNFFYDNCEVDKEEIRCQQTLTDPLFTFLDNELSEASEILYREVFMMCLKELSKVVFESIKIMLCTPSKKFKLRKLRQGEWEALRYVIFEIKEYFYNDGDGVDMESLSGKEYQDMMACVAMYMTPTPGLISSFRVAECKVLQDISPSAEVNILAEIKQDDKKEFKLLVEVANSRVHEYGDNMPDINGKIELTLFGPKGKISTLFTTVKESERNPIWNEVLTFKLKCKKQNLSDYMILVRLIDHKENNPIVFVVGEGRFDLGAGMLDSLNSFWQKLIPEREYNSNLKNIMLVINSRIRRDRKALAFFKMRRQKL
eukprot:Nk52_evm12s280 gene=Nk52_evmTU12s280